jgi:hypothetical protein
MKSFRLRKRLMVAFLGCLCGMMLYGCPATTGVTTAPVTVSSVVADAQNLLTYATPWLQAAESVATTLCAANVLNTTQCNDVTLASTTANMAAATIASNPTAAGVAALATAMIPVYTSTTAAAPAGK